MRGCWTLLGLTIPMSVLSADPEADPPSPHAVIQRAAKHVRSIDSIRFSARSEIVYLKTDKGSPVESNQFESVRFYASGAKYRYEYKTWESDPNESLIDVLYVCDGSRYQLTDHKRGTTTDGGAPTATNPLLCPLIFLPTGNHDWTGARSPASWEKFAARCRYVETRNEGGSEVVVLGTNLSTPDSAKRTGLTSFSKQLDWYPIQFTASSTGDSFTSRVTRFHTVSTKDGVLAVPLRIEWTNKEGASSATYRWNVAPESLQVNQPIDDGLFAIPVARAEQNHAVAGTRIRSGSEPQKPLPPSSSTETSRSHVVRVASITLLALLLCGGLYRWIGRRRRAAPWDTVLV